ncbi:MAG: isochorismate-pyruvate lyase [Caldilineaceae bacterium SB0670_bin_27]|uniref:Isochorismate-pyruvate lyase n=1 Tax=Caldilineaceae bacterium SB0664_bin_27 TaxID=2605260 RepID=A0A6B0Z2E0_9CHLR|nr:isochorismate-pyruvate lyase [Caldilineaceae bacterium SB0664_bin_27]MYJ78485.1 isochorismate-pyruvate lyase [Caldilineaceae bacterium SB0670_bin_27]
MPDPQNCNSLDEVRSEIDRLDNLLVAIISQRQDYVHAAAGFKRNQEEVHARERQRSMLAARRQWAESEGVDPDLIESLFRKLVDHFIRVELSSLSERNSAELRDTSPQTST